MINKNILLFLVLIFSFFSCEEETKSSAVNPIDYEFTVKLNGVSHRIQGNTSMSVPIAGIGSNSCYSSSMSTMGKSLQLELNDPSASNYVSGQNISFLLSFENLLLGNSLATVASVNYGANSYLSSFIDGLGAYNNSSIFRISSAPTSDYTPIPLTFDILDLGTPSVQNPNPTTSFSDMYIWGEALVGSFSGTVYAQSGSILGNYDIPFQLEISFEVIRYMY
jgi:hypothetical protein